MSTFAVGLIICSAVMHATWNALGRRAEDPYAYFFAFNLASLVIWLPVAVIAGWDESLSAGDVLVLTLSGSLQVIYFVLLAAAYQAGELSLVYPIARGSSVAIVPIAGFLIFSERPTSLGWLGIATTLLGIAIVAAVAGASSLPDRIGEHRRGALLALMTGLTISAYSLVDKWGVERVNPVVYGYGLIFAAVALQLPYVILRRRHDVRDQFRSFRGSVVAGAILSMGTYLLVLIALTESNVGYVVPLRETSIIFALLIGIAVLRESPSRSRLAAAVVIAGGALLIAIGG